MKYCTVVTGEQQQAWLQQAVAEGKGKIPEAHPLCVQCLKEGHAVTATVVDHIRPHRGDPVLFWDEKNWQSLCKPCHDKKTWNEDNNPEYRF